MSVERGLEATATDDLVRSQALPVSHVYKQALLLSLADPQHLSQQDIKQCQLGLFPLEAGWRKMRTSPAT